MDAAEFEQQQAQLERHYRSQQWRERFPQPQPEQTMNHRTMMQESHDEAMACAQIEADQRHANVHPVFAGILNTFCRPTNDGQHQAQAEPPPLAPIDHLRAGGYKREADLMAEALKLLKDAREAMLDDRADIAAGILFGDICADLIAKLEGGAA